MTTHEAMRMLGSMLILHPAYGRTYATEEEMRIAWVTGKDFKIKAGPYTSIHDLELLRKNSSSVWIFDYLSGHRICVA